MRWGSGRLYRRYRLGEAAIHAYADDYAFFIWGLIELYGATFEVRYLEEAVNLQNLMIGLFWDDVEGGFFFTAAKNPVGFSMKPAYSTGMMTVTFCPSTSVTP